MKTKLILILSVLLLFSCRLDYEYISTNYYPPLQFDDPHEVKFFLSEENSPAYKDIGLIRLKTYEDKMSEIILPAKKIAANNGGNCIIYKQTSSFGGGDHLPYYTYEFIVGYTKYEN